MDPITAHKADGDAYAKDPEIRRLKRTTRSNATYAVAFQDWDTRTSLTDEEHDALTAVDLDCIHRLNPEGMNRYTESLVREWSAAHPKFAFFHQKEEGEPVKAFVAGEWVSGDLKGN